MSDEIKALRDFLRGALAAEHIDAGVRIESPPQIVNDDLHSMITEGLTVIIAAQGNDLATAFRKAAWAYIKGKVKAGKLPAKTLLVDKDGKTIADED